MRRLICLLVLALASGTLSSVAAEAPKLGLLPLASSSLSATKTELLTDSLRGELLKTGLFVVLDTASKQAPDKAVSGRIENFGDTLVVSLKLTDLATGVLDFSETLSVPNEGQLFQAIKQLGQLLASRYRSGLLKSALLTPEAARSQLETSWQALGAELLVLKELIDRNASTETFLAFRQYDGTVTPLAYLELLKQNVDLEVLRTFLQAGVSFADARRALSMGITRLEKYQTQFAPAGFTFREYLEAYGLGLVSPQEYKTYRSESGRDFISVGLGGESNTVPITNTAFKFLLGQFAWEHSWTKNPSDLYRINSEAGVYLLNLFLPAPYVSVELMAGAKPFFAKVGLGAFSEVLVGGHSAVNLKLGLEIDQRYELTFLIALLGTDTAVDYTTFEPWDGRPHNPIQFPYYGLLFTYKFPLVDGSSR